MKINSKELKTLMPDEQIVELYWKRDERAIQATDDKYGQFLLRIAYNILHDTPDCEECRNDAYLGIWNRIPPSRPRVFPAFITAIMRKTAIDKYRENTRKKRIPSDMTVSFEDLKDVLRGDDIRDESDSAEEIARVIDNYLITLSERQRFVFVGRFYMGDTLEVIAGELSLHPSTVHREIEKIKQGLKAELERSGIYV